MDVFAKIIAKEIPAQIIYEDERVIAFKDIKPLRTGHFLVVPKAFSENLFDISDEDLTYLIKKARELAVKETKALGISGFSIQINNGKEAGQEVFHTHIHVIPSNK